MKQIWQYCKIIIISLIFFLYLGEYYLTFIVFDGGSQNNKDLRSKIELYKKKTNKEYDTRSKVDVFRQLVKSDSNVSVTLQPAHKTGKDFLYLSGISNSRTVDCNENGYYSTFLSDRFGFNNEDKEWDSKNFEFVIIGDSLALGSCVNRPDNISSILKSLSGKSVLNLGYVGNGPLSEYAALVEYLPKNVKNILWIYTEHTDLVDLISELKNENLKKYLINESFFSNLKLKQNSIDENHKKNIKQALIDINENTEYWDSYYSKKKVFLRFLRLNKLKNFVKSLNSRKKQSDEKIDDLAIKNLEKILILTKKLALNNNSNLYFVFVGSYYRYKSVIFSDKEYLENYKKIIKIVEQLEIPVINLHEDFFLRQKKPLEYYPFKKYGHFTEEGYKKITEFIYNKVSK